MMEILDRKSTEINAFFAALEELADCIRLALQNRTPHLNGDKFLTGKDVCRLLNVSPRTLQTWRTRGKIPYLRLKGKILYRETEVLKWLGDSGNKGN